LDYIILGGTRNTVSLHYGFNLLNSQNAVCKMLTAVFLYGASKRGKTLFTSSFITFKKKGGQQQRGTAAAESNYVNFGEGQQLTNRNGEKYMEF
jgi:hypothetical protein